MFISSGFAPRFVAANVIIAAPARIGIAGQPYVMFNDSPKLARLREQFPDLYRTK
jgi:hypothetical protein